MKYRSISHAIGFFDLVSAIIGILVALLFCLSFIFGWFVGQENNNPEVITTEPPKDEDTSLTNNIMGIMIFAIVMFGILGAIQIYGSVCLIKGTKKSVSPKDGLNFCLVWRRLSIAFLMLMSLSLLRALITTRGGIEQDAIYSLIGIGLRVVALVIVQLYIKQLQMASTSVMVTI